MGGVNNYWIQLDVAKLEERVFYIKWSLSRLYRQREFAIIECNKIKRSAIKYWISRLTGKLKALNNQLNDINSMIYKLEKNLKF